ncbi:ABC transporter permease [Actinomycetota bacterium]|nr:ABC transporter permease [Actinomycetota bacterium]
MAEQRMVQKILTRKLKKSIAPYLLILPAVILLAIFVFGLVNGILQGFGIAPYINSYDFTLDYYAQAFTDRELVSSILFSLYLATASTLLATVLAIILSSAICKFKNQRIIRLFGIQVPMMIASVVVVLGMLTLFSSTGLCARILYALGLLKDSADMPSILGAANGWGIILVFLWCEIPYITFCTITIMAHIGDSFGEAAASLGASPLRSFFSITLPLCKNAIIKAALVVWCFIFGSYEVASLLGPTVPSALPVLSYYKFKMVDITNRSFSMALNGIIIAICLIATVVYFVILYRERKQK